VKAFTGSELLKTCKESNDSFCVGYVSAVVDAVVSDVDRRKFFCIPNGVTYDQLMKVAVKYLEQDPKNLHWSAHALVHNAILDAYRCPKN
jgi:hypothetical protein